MKIGIDFDKKEISLENSENLEKFIKVIKKLLPKGEWKKYKLNVNTTINYTYPIYYTYGYDYFTSPYLTVDCNNTNNVDITNNTTSGVYMLSKYNVGDDISSDTVKSTQIIYEIV